MRTSPCKTGGAEAQDRAGKGKRNCCPAGAYKALQQFNENERMHGHAYSTYTNLIYKSIFGKDAKHLRERIRHFQKGRTAGLFQRGGTATGTESGNACRVVLLNMAGAMMR